MSNMDPVSDLLTRIRNAHLAKHDRVDVPTSKLKAEICRILKEQGFIRNFKLVDQRPLGAPELLLRQPRHQLVVARADLAGPFRVVLHGLHLGMQREVAHQRRLGERERTHLGCDRFLCPRGFEGRGERAARGLIEQRRGTQRGQHDGEHGPESQHEARTDTQAA